MNGVLDGFEANDMIKELKKYLNTVALNLTINSIEAI